MAEDGRPFYHRFAWAYDLLVADPVEPWIEAVGTLAGGPAAVLDAGCGTGRHAVALAARGHDVTGVDGSDDLLDVARARARGRPVRFVRADLRTLDLGARFAVVACRGVLNDVLDDRDRDAVLAAFARHLRGGGALIIDVRDRDATARRYADGAERRRSVPVEGGELVFSWRGRFDAAAGCLLVDETHRLRAGGSEQVARHAHAMRCWTPDELRDRLGRAGFTGIALRPAAGAERADRLLATAAIHLER